jgi:hypothetical protein
MNYIEPKPNLAKFTCPHCHTISHQRWRECDFDFTCHAIAVRAPGTSLSSVFGTRDLNPLKTSKCDCCGNSTVWVQQMLLYPNTGSAPLPNEDLPAAVKAIYGEAASVARLSPRAAAALLRLAVEMLCKDLGQSGTLNEMIQSLVDARRIPSQILKALDVIRVVGNEAVHPGEISKLDDEKSVQGLFAFINLVAEHAITLPRAIDKAFGDLPEGARSHIAKRTEPK